MPVKPYLMFNGRCEEAIDFYKKSLGAEVLMLMRFKDSPEAPPPGMVPANWDNKVMHSCLRIGDGNVMASDGCSEAGSFQGFSLSLPAADEADAHKKFAALGEGGQVHAARQNLLVALLWHGYGPLRRRLDGRNRGVKIGEIFHAKDYAVSMVRQ